MIQFPGIKLQLLALFSKNLMADDVHIYVHIFFRKSDSFRYFMQFKSIFFKRNILYCTVYFHMAILVSSAALDTLSGCS